MESNFAVRLTRRRVVLGAASVLAGACARRPTDTEPSIEFTQLPPSGTGNSEIVSAIGGRVRHVTRGQKVVLYAHSGKWWVQPLANQPFTAIRNDLTWTNSTHPGAQYAALLVNEGYQPPSTTDTLPSRGGGVVAVVTSTGRGVVQNPVPKTLDFSGYEWEIGQMPNNPGGTPNFFDPENAWTDSEGHLHLRIARQANRWTSGRITLTESLGYGTYRFLVRDLSFLEPSAVLSLTIQEQAAAVRELDIELSRWGELSGKNAQYVVQPYYVAENSLRFTAPSGRLSHSIRWEPRRAFFETTRADSHGGDPPAIAGHLFTSGVPVAGSEFVSINLYVFGENRNPLQHQTEVVIEKFDFLP